MRLDLGSPFTVLWKESADALGLEQTRMTNRTVVRWGSGQVTHRASMKSFALGAHDFGEAKLLVAPPGEVTRMRPELIVGMLGAEVFASLDFELDFSRSVLHVFSQNRCADKLVYWSEQFASAPLFRGLLREFYIPVELAGKKVEAAFATDRDETTLSLDASKRLYGLDPPIRRSRWQITSAGLTMEGVEIHLVPADKRCRLSSAGAEAAVRATTSAASGRIRCISGGTCCRSCGSISRRGGTSCISRPRKRRSEPRVQIRCKRNGIMRVGSRRR